MDEDKRRGPRGPLFVPPAEGRAVPRPTGSSPFQFTLGSWLSVRNPRPGPPPIALDPPLVTPQCAQHFSPKNSHNLQVNKNHLPQQEEQEKKSKKGPKRPAVQLLVAARQCSIDTMTEQQRRSEASWNSAFSLLAACSGLTTPGSSLSVLSPGLQPFLTLTVPGVAHCSRV